MSMKLGPIDFTQPSTWRGAAGIIALFGLTLSPELTNQIAIALGAALSAIELFRNEYARPKDPLPPIELQSRTTAVVQSDRVRQPVPPEPATTRSPESPGFSDR
jgi:hypothetical protein